VRLRLPSGRRILVTPVFFWESPRKALCVVRTTGAFHPAHVTTRMCLDLLEEQLQAHEYKTLLDVGCGSGILALTGAALGTDLCVGLDINHRAVRLARANAGSNGLDGQTLWFTGNCAAVRGVFDCVVANLPFEVLIGLLGDLVRLMATGGALILSGFHDIHWYEVRAEFDRLGLKTLRELTRDLSFYGIPPSGSFTWKALVARRKG
jgi:ribosomal protein L11 methylase PrmA